MIVAAYRAKHCIQVPKSGISFFACSRSALRTRNVLPARSLERPRMFPLAGGSSARSMNWPFRMASRMAGLMLGSPGATRTGACDAAVASLGSVGGLAWLVAALVVPRPRPARTLGGGMLSLGAPVVCQEKKKKKKRGGGG